MSFSILNPDAVRKSHYATEPFPHFLGQDVLLPEMLGKLRDDFPNIAKPGFLTVDDIQLSPTYETLIREIESPEFTEVLSERFGLDLSPYPRLTTVRKLSQAKDGRIHTDGKSKVMTMLIYLNDSWSADGGGRLRVLYDGKNFEPYACEVPPVTGAVFGFLRGDNSGHGHLPFKGERPVIQTAWVKDNDELLRKKKRNSVAKFFKGIFGR